VEVLYNPFTGFNNTHWYIYVTLDRDSNWPHKGVGIFFYLLYGGFGYLVLVPNGLSHKTAIKNVGSPTLRNQTWSIKLVELCTFWFPRLWNNALLGPILCGVLKEAAQKATPALLVSKKRKEKKKPIQPIPS
jgi:hypothetical protein